MALRTVKRLHAAYRDDIGDLVTRRPVPGPGLSQLDPFLFLNHHGPQTYPPNNRGLPFGPHPHRGFETVTFIVEGELAHLDTGGHESVIGQGGVQWMTAGSGLVHAEISPSGFKRQGGPLEILQLWLNLPSRLKMTQPRYTGLQGDEIPWVELADGVQMSLSAGELNGTSGPFRSVTGVFIGLVELSAGARATLPAPEGRSVLFYAVQGSVTVGGAVVPKWTLAELDDGDEVEVAAADGPALLLFGHADPINEPVVSHGPFVMNTREEIVQAVQDYQRGLFGDLRV